MKKFNGFDENGNLPPGIYNMTLDEIEEIFSKNKSLKRREIMKAYKNHLTELKNTGYYLDHWIDGSFVTSKENPNDIDTLTEFDGQKADENNEKNLINELINNSKEKTNGTCHSLKVYRYPYYQKENFERYLKQKRRILILLFGKDKRNFKKGIIHLIGSGQ